MSFENIQLPPFLLQDLYKDFLIDDKSYELLSHPLKIADITSLGSNKKNILILLNEPGPAVIDKKDLLFLEGILKACNLRLDDIAIVNINTKPETDYSKLVSSFEPGQLLLFGVEPSDIKLPLHFPHNQIQKHISQLYVSFPSLKNIASDISRKKELWATLQKLFNLN